MSHCLFYFSITAFIHWETKKRNQNKHKLTVVEEIK